MKCMSESGPWTSHTDRESTYGVRTSHHITSHHITLYAVISLLLFLFLAQLQSTIYINSIITCKTSFDNSYRFISFIFYTMHHVMLCHIMLCHVMLGVSSATVKDAHSPPHSSSGMIRLSYDING